MLSTLFSTFSTAFSAVKCPCRALLGKGCTHSRCTWTCGAPSAPDDQPMALWKQIIAISHYITCIYIYIIHIYVLYYVSVYIYMLSVYTTSIFCIYYYIYITMSMYIYIQYSIIFRIWKDQLQNIAKYVINLLQPLWNLSKTWKIPLQFCILLFRPAQLKQVETSETLCRGAPHCALLR